MNRPTTQDLDQTSVRADKWLWAARFYKTRRLATEALHAGHVRLNGERCKPSKSLKPGDRLDIERNGTQLELEVLALAMLRGNAQFAQTLYLETPASIARREQATALAKMAHGEQPTHKPDKRERRQIRSFLERNG
nr:RNA-binding S4 domain-containing protein [Zoogloeaceae bacterium]